MWGGGMGVPARKPEEISEEFTVCPCCGTDFHVSVRCLDHLADSRRPRCANYVIAHCKQLPAKRVAVLDAIDRETRRSALWSGRTHVVVSRPAIIGK